MFAGDRSSVPMIDPITDPIPSVQQRTLILASHKDKLRVEEPNQSLNFEAYLYLLGSV